MRAMLMIAIVASLALAGGVVGGRGATATRGGAGLKLLRTFQRNSGEEGYAVGFGSLWVGASNEGQAVTRIDLTTGKLRTIAALAGNDDSIGIGPNAVWYSDFENGALRRIDPALNRVTHVTTGLAGAANAAFVGGDVWESLHHAQSVAEIDGKTGRELARVRLPSPGGGVTASGPASITYAYGSIWVAIVNTNSVDRIDPRRRTVTAVYKTGAGSGGTLVAAGGSLWAAAATLVRINPATNAITMRLRISAVGLAAAGGDLWAATAKGAIDAINPATGAIESTTQPSGAFFTDIQSADGDLWAWDGNKVQVDEYRPAR
jgi:streptogramin lyase